MRAPRARRLAGGLILAAAAQSLAAFGCSLGLDASLIGKDASADGAGITDSGPIGDADAKVTSHADGADGVADVTVGGDGGACTTDADCMAAAAAGGACVSGATCDPTWHVCMLQVCATGSTCKAEACQPSMSCSQPASLGFTAASFPVAVGGVSGGDPTGAIAAAWPFVFVATTNGVAVYDVIDPTNTAPPLVPLHGVPFVPLELVAQGRRIYFVNGVQGTPPSYKQAIAWVDVPQNPFVASLTATPAWLTVDQKPMVSVFPSGADALSLVYSASFLPVALAKPPLSDSTSLTSFPCVGLPTNGALVAPTGTRLLSYRYDSAQHANFALVDNAGLASAQTTTEQGFTAFGPLDGQATFAPGGDGSVLWLSAPLDELDTGTSDGIASARLSWLVDSPTAANYDSSHHVDLVSYSPAASGTVVGPVAWVDANTAIAFSALSSSSLTTTLVQMATKSPSAIVPGKNQRLTVGPGALGVAVSGGFVYALEQNDSKNETCRVQIFAPSCGGD